MYQLNDIEVWREHHSELLREAEEAHLARRFGSARRWRERRQDAGNPESWRLVRALLREGW